MSSYDRWLEQPYVDAANDDAFAEMACERAANEVVLDCGHDQPTDPEVIASESSRHAWEATVRFRCAVCPTTTEHTVSDEADFEAIAESQAEFRAEQLNDW